MRSQISQIDFGNVLREGFKFTIKLTYDQLGACKTSFLVEPMASCLRETLLCDTLFIVMYM